MDYIEFASKICFFEFIQTEFYEPHFDVDKYKDEFELLNGDLNIDKLTKLLETHPAIIDIFEEYFQMKRFTNSQYIHFCFDVRVLNIADPKSIIAYAEKSIFQFENGNVNKDFMKIYKKRYSDSADNSRIIFDIKKSLTLYVDRCIKNREIFHNHIRESIGSRLRISRYLVENLKADSHVKLINIRNCLSLKRYPTKRKSLRRKNVSIKGEDI